MRGNSESRKKSRRGAVLAAAVVILYVLPLVIAAVLTAITLGALARNKAMDKVSASVYLSPKDGFQIDQKVDQYLNEFTTHRRIPRNEGRSGGGGGGSSTHSSSSGTSHGGGGRSF